MSLPFLPGNTFDRKFAQNKHHLSHHFDKFNGVNVMGDSKPGVGGQPLPGQDLRPKNSLYPRGEGADRPAWVAFDKQVLSFDGYFQESVVERPGEQYRVRKVKILFYLEDDTIQVSEPRVKNAGYNQGTIINRHRIPRARPYDNTFYTIEDFNVQREVEFYGKKFKITDCDAFTRNFLTKLGVRVPDPIQSPSDPYQNIRGIQDGAQNPLRPYERVDSLKQFLEHDRQVLRFDCVWDDRDTKFGELRRFKLHYYLADDTIEILEKLPPNCGRDSNSTFLSRQKLPKEIINLGKPGDKPTRTVLNVIGNFFDGGRYILDNLKTGAINVNYYQDGDLMINRIVNVFGRKMLITDCDEFTKNYYANKYGVANFEPVQYDKVEYGGRRLERTNPPYNGFGSEEDSLASCNKMIPEPPKKDFVKWIQYDRNGLESNILRYLAKLNVKDPIQAERRFVISFFPSDDSILVHEPPIKNSGVSGGKFLERMKIKKPNHPPYSTELPEYFSASDFFVGARLLLNQFDFTILDADEYCFKFMENNKDMFPYSNLQAVKRKVAHSLQPDQLAALESALRHADSYNAGVVSYRAFMNAACSTLGNSLNEQEIITLARAYALETRKDYDDQSVAAAAQENLRKNNFDLFTRLRETLQNCDTYDRDGTCSLNEARSVCKGFRLPMPDYLLDMVLQNSRTETGNVDVRTLVGVLNWKENPIQNPRSSSSGQNDDHRGDETKLLFQTTTLERLQLKINYEALISELRH